MSRPKTRELDSYFQEMIILKQNIAFENVYFKRLNLFKFMTKDGFSL